MMDMFPSARYTRNPHLYRHMCKSFQRHALLLSIGAALLTICSNPASARLEFTAALAPTEEEHHASHRAAPTPGTKESLLQQQEELQEQQEKEAEVEEIEQQHTYLTSEQISAEIRKIVDQDPEKRFTVERLSDEAWTSTSENQNVGIDVVHFQPNAVNSSPNGKKAFFLFGLHARELISSETGLQFLKSLQQNGSPFEIKLIIDVNPLGRRQVLNKEGCQRYNENDIDLNRNFDSGFGQSDDDVNPTGSSAFSEPEARILRKVLSLSKIFLFITIAWDGDRDSDTKMHGRNDFLVYLFIWASAC